jgi:hypothetical protein
MHLQDKALFVRVLTRIYGFYGQKLSEPNLDLWWQTMQSFDIKVLTEALSLHLINRDNGQFLPKPADIMRVLQGSSQDSALIAWTKVDKALHSVGPYASVVFDDEIIQQVLQDMGGWIALGTKKEAEWPFVANEFVSRYRGYCQHGRLKIWPAVLMGMAQASNECHGFSSAAPVLIGDPQKAQYVLSKGTQTSRIGITRLTGEASFKQLSELSHAVSSQCTTTKEYQ